MVLQLPSSSDVPLAIWSLQSTSVLARASGGMWPCSLELFSGVEAAWYSSLVLEHSFFQRVCELMFGLSPNLPPHVAREF